MYDDRTSLAKQVAADLRSFFGAQVFETIIPRNVRLAEAPSHGMPVMFYDIHSKGAESYIQLAKEGHSECPQKRIGQGIECRPDTGAGTAASRRSRRQSEWGRHRAPTKLLSDGWLEVDIDLIDPSPYQPRDSIS